MCKKFIIFCFISNDLFLIFRTYGEATEHVRQGRRGSAFMTRWEGNYFYSYLKL